MKKYGIILLALMVCGAVFAAVTTDISIRQVRDPVQFRTIWNDSIGGLNGSTNYANVATNVTIALTRQAVASATNGTVAITFTPQYGTFTNQNTASNAVVQVLMTNATCTAVFTPQAASVAAVTNAVLTIQKP